MTLSDIETAISSYLTIRDFDALRLVLATAASHVLPGDPVWLIIVGPPSSAKTEFINLLRYAEGVKHLSSLTPRTLASGFEGSGGRETSFLARLEDSILAIKDLTTILEMDRNARKEVLAQLREVYDGKFDMGWGTGKYFQWEGKVTLIAGVTPVIHKYWGVMSTLGPRFLFVSPVTADRSEVALRALMNADAEDVRGETAKLVAVWLRGLSKVNPKVPESQHPAIVQIADLVTRGRTAVDRDARTREVEWQAEPEMPARVAKQLHKLARGLARIEERTETTEEDLRRLRRVGMDTLPPLRREILEHLTAGEKTLEGLMESVKLGESTVRRTVEELKLLGLIEHREPIFSIKAEWGKFIAGMTDAVTPADSAV